MTFPTILIIFWLIWLILGNFRPLMAMLWWIELVDVKSEFERNWQGVRWKKSENLQSMVLQTVETTISLIQKKTLLLSSQSQPLTRQNHHVDFASFLACICPFSHDAVHRARFSWFEIETFPFYSLMFKDDLFSIFF